MNHPPVAVGPSYYHLHHSYASPQVGHGQYHEQAFTPVGCRPLQLPLQQQQTPQQQHHSAEQLSLAAGFHDPNFRSHHEQQLHHPHGGLPIRPRLSAYQQRQAMAYQQQSEEELAQLQKLSNEYEPEVIVRRLEFLGANFHER